MCAALCYFKSVVAALGIDADTGPAPKALQAYEQKARPPVLHRGNAIIKNH